MILALEGASGILETEEDLHEFIDEGGIRIVTPLHLSDDEFGGVAFLRGTHVLANPISWLIQFLNPKYVDGVRVNTNGLTSDGRTLILKLHGATRLDRSGSCLGPLGKGNHRELEASHLPLLYTHAMLAENFTAPNAGSPEEELSRIARSGGIVGLMPSEEMLAGAPRSAACPSALSALATEYGESCESARIRQCHDGLGL